MGSEAAGLPSDGSGHVERCATKLCVSAVPVVRPGEGRKSRVRNEEWLLVSFS